MKDGDTQSQNHERAHVFVTHFKHILFHTLTHRDEMVQALLGRENIFKNTKPPTVEVLTADFDKFVEDLDREKSLVDSDGKTFHAGAYSLTSPKRIMGAIREAEFTQVEIDTLSNSEILFSVAAIFHSFTVILNDIRNAAPKFINAKGAVDFEPLDDNGLMKSLELQKLITNSCNKVCKEVIHAYFQSQHRSNPVTPFPDNEQAYLSLVKEIGSELTAHVINVSTFATHDNTGEPGGITHTQPESAKNNDTTHPELSTNNKPKKAPESLTLTPPVSDTPNAPLPDTSWTTRARQVGLALLALVAIVTVGYFTFPLILPLIGAVLTGAAATAVTWVILAVAAVAIAGLFFGLNEFVEWFQAAKDSNEPPAEAQQLKETNEPLNSNQMSGLGHPVTSPTESVSNSPSSQSTSDSEEELRPGESDKQTPPTP